MTIDSCVFCGETGRHLLDCDVRHVHLKPKELTPSEISWDSGYKAGVIDGRKGKKAMNERIEQLEAALECAEESLTMFIGMYGDHGASLVLKQVKDALKGETV
jgi:hypothetical protein